MQEQERELLPRPEEALTTFPPPLPRQYGHWYGMAGNSTWLFDLNAQRLDIYTGGRSTWQAILARCPFPAADRVVFAQNYPDFSPYIVTIENRVHRISVRGDYSCSSITINRQANFREADGAIAGAIHTQASVIAALRQDEKFTWHELETCQRMILVPRAIHGYVPHGGGIEVLKTGPIGAASADLPGGQARILDGRRFWCIDGLCQTTCALPVQGGSREIPFYFYCDDGQETPSAAQLEREKFLRQNWDRLTGAAWQTLQAYVDEEWGGLHGAGYGDSAVLTSVEIFPEDDESKTLDIGLLYENFAGDPEHGLGVRILGDQKDSLLAGPGDVAL